VTNPNATDLKYKIQIWQIRILAGSVTSLKVVINCQNVFNSRHFERFVANSKAITDLQIYNLDSITKILWEKITKLALLILNRQL